MGRILIILGILVILAGSGILFMLTTGANSEFVQTLISGNFCDAHEEFTQRYRASWNGQSTVFYCDDREGNLRDITGEIVPVMIAGFGIPLLLGMILIFGGAGRMRRNRGLTADALRQQANLQWGEVEVYQNVQSSNNFEHLSPAKQAQIQNIIDSVMGSIVPQAQLTLAERLQ